MNTSRGDSRATLCRSAHARTRRSHVHRGAHSCPSVGGRLRAGGGPRAQAVKNNPEASAPNQYILGRPISNGLANNSLSSSTTPDLEGFATGRHGQGDSNGGVRGFSGCAAGVSGRADRREGCLDAGGDGIGRRLEVAAVGREV